MEPADRPWLLRGTVLALAVVVGLAAWLLTRGDDDEAVPVPVESESRIVTAAELARVADAVGHPVYWLGPVAGTELELTTSGEGGVQVRYLESSAEAGEESTRALTVGSYPVRDPARALKALAAEPGAVVRRLGDGPRVVSSANAPTSVYFASPDNSVQVEVYDPSPERAMSTALSGRVRPAG